MSCEQRENGSFNFKKAGFNKVMRSVRELFQEFDQFQFECATAIYEFLKANKVKKNKEDSLKFLLDGSYFSNNDCLDDAGSSILKRMREMSFYPSFSFSLSHDIVHGALDEIFRNDNNTRLKPRRIAFPKLTNKDRTFSRTFNDLITISSVEDDNCIYWSVRSGNRSVDNSLDNPVTSKFFKIIEQYDWKYGERGSTTCVSESFDDDPCSSDDCVEKTRCFEKLTKKEMAQKKRIAKRMFESGMYY